MDESYLAETWLRWYDQRARRLPWREPGAGPWAILVSEVMLQQTPVARVQPVYTAWLERWPDPAGLAAAPAADAVRMWGKLGYPRRALRLHECARALVADHDGQVPTDVATLLRLPGIGEYTARAVAAFAFGQRVPVVDTNVRRVHARAILGQAEAGPPSTTRDLAAVEALLPPDPATAARLSVALMEFGALVCVARSPRCAACVIVADCAWQRAGRPPATGPAPAPQRFAGTDRQVRGKLLDILRATDEPVTRAQLDMAWPEPVQRERALNSLLADGLVTEVTEITEVPVRSAGRGPTDRTEKPGPLYALPG
jgi:A/G-specific adenine glycosylase